MSWLTRLLSTRDNEGMYGSEICLITGLITQQQFGGDLKRLGEDSPFRAAREC